MAFFLWAAALVVLGIAYGIYSLYPKPLPGIPYHAESAQTIWGDLREVRGKARQTNESSAAFFTIPQRLGTPIAQLLLPSIRRPFVIVDDARETEDILLRRNKEFDRSGLTSQFFRPLIPHCTIVKYTTPQLKAQKRIWSDVMNTDFLRRVVAPNLQKAGAEVVELWRLRAKQADGKPFEVHHDFDHAALDAIWVAVFGSYLGVTRREIQSMPGGAAAGSDSASEEALSAGAKIQFAMKFLNNFVDNAYRSESPLPRFSMWLASQKPEFRRVRRVTYAEIQRLMAAAVARFQRVVVDGLTDGEEHDTCAMDLVLRRELLAAKKAGHPPPDPTQNPEMLDELLLLLLAGHDSTANTLSWFVKLIAAHQSCQSTLRTALQTAFPTTKIPTTAQILDADIPYLDALIEETVRCSATAGIIARRAVVDTTILGCAIPKDTNVLLNTRFFHPAAPPEAVPETLRSAASRAAQAKRSGREALGAGAGLAEFEPARWLFRGEDGRDAFDAGALPALVFGGGLRGCFGKKLAMLELRIIITLLVLNFEFDPLPEELRSMAGVEKVFRRPKTCHVKLRAI